MLWIKDILYSHSSLQATLVIAMVIALGIALGKIKVGGISLGVTFVFFVGILAGHVGLSIDPQMLQFAQSFGLVLFVYELGLQVGPGFIGSFRSGGIKLNLLSMGNILLGTAMAVVAAIVLDIPFADMSGILCGASTNTPALAAAQQTLSQLGLDASGAALGCAVTYPLGVVGVIVALFLLDRLPISRKAREIPVHDENDSVYVATFQVKNPACFGISVQELVGLTSAKFVISRVWRKDSPAETPDGHTCIQEGDRLMVVTEEKYVKQLTILFGLQEENENWNRQDVDWDHLDSRLISKHIIITRPAVNGRRLGSLRLHARYGVTVSRVNRAGVHLLATPRLVLQFGDRITAVGDAKSIEKIEHELGGHVNTLHDPNLASIFVGIIFGLVVGAIPIFVPGVGMPVRLGLAGGPIIAGILMGAYGPRLHLRTYTTRSANLMLRSVGLSLYLACLGLASGAQFFATVVRPEGALWVCLGFVITVLPVVVMALVSMRFFHLDLGTTYGMLCGSQANPMSLNYANDIIPNDSPAVSYATVYPLGMFLRVVIIQILLLVLL